MELQVLIGITVQMVLTNSFQLGCCRLVSDLRLMSREVTELQGGGIRGRQILYICNLEAHHPQIFRKCYFLYSFHITEEVFS